MKFELQPYNRDVPDEELLADLRAVAAKLSAGSLTQAQYDQHGRFCAATIKKRMGWNRGLQMAGLAPSRLTNISREALVKDIQRVAAELRVTKLGCHQYEQHRGYTRSVVYRHFGNWRGAVQAAGLQVGFNYAITDEELFDNMERVWRHLGRQPTKDEMAPPLSCYAVGTYTNRFGGYRKALEAFVAAVNDDQAVPNDPAPAECSPPAPSSESVFKHKTPRTINWRLKYKTMLRDGARCCLCGRSVSNHPDLELEVDHKISWSKGGETVLENLQTLCQRCNGGKSNLPWTLD